MAQAAGQAVEAAGQHRRGSRGSRLRPRLLMRGPAVAAALLPALLAVLAFVQIAQAQTVTLQLSDAEIAEDGGVATVTATLSSAVSTGFTVEVSAEAMFDGRLREGRILLSGNATLTFAANATTSTGTVTITAVDNDGHTPQDMDGVGVRVAVAGAVTGATGVTGPDPVTLTIAEDDGVGTATDRDRPTLSSGTVNGDRVELVFSEALVQTRTLSPSAFRYQVDSGPTLRAAILEVAGGTTVVLTLQEAVEQGDSVQVRYVPPRDRLSDYNVGIALRDAAGNVVYPFEFSTPQPDAPNRVELVLDSDSIAEDGGVATVTATLSSAVSTEFTVEVSAEAFVDRFPSRGRISLSGNTTLTFAADATTSTGTVTITAIDNDGHAPQGTDGVGVRVEVAGTVTGLTGVPGPDPVTLTIADDDGVGSAADRDRPALSSGTVNGDRVELVFSEALVANTTITATQFQYQIDSGTDIRAASVEVADGTTVVLTLQQAVERESLVSVRYAPPKDRKLDYIVADSLRDAAENLVYPFKRFLLVNRTPHRIGLALDPRFHRRGRRREQGHRDDSGGPGKRLDRDGVGAGGCRRGAERERGSHLLRRRDGEHRNGDDHGAGQRHGGAQRGGDGLRNDRRRRRGRGVGAGLPWR